MNGYQFLYPRSRQFPFDETCSAIVRELEKRNWNVPKIAVDFDLYGTGEQKLRMVRYLRGGDFKLWFSRIQCSLPDGHFNDTAAVMEITIPRMELSVYEDESGPTFYLYAGSDWNNDRIRFMDGSKANSKLYHEPRLYLKYKGSWQKPGEKGPHYIYPGQRAPYLIHDDDLGREHELLAGEPAFFETTKIMEDFRKYLEDVVLRYICQQPIPREKTNLFAAPKPLPVPTAFQNLFCFGEWSDARRITTGQKNPADMKPADRYAMQGNGYRLVPLDARNDGSVPKIANEGFLWCGIGAVDASTPIEKLDVPGHYRWSDHEQFVIRLKLNRANDVYIADMTGQEEYKAQIFHDNPKQDRLTSEQYAEYLRIPGRTIVPASEYAGNYKKPVVLVARELGFDEVEIVSGPQVD